MKTARYSLWAIIFAALLCAPRLSAQNGAIEFVAHATPSGGVDEPVRGFPFYLLTKSYEEIRQEAEAAYPQPDMDAFIDTLDVGPELKAWMKKNHWVMLSGEDFIHKVKTPAVMDVPEFFKAYMARNADTNTVGFPKPKYKPSDQQKDPAKYEKLHKEYLDAIRMYVDMNPESIDGIDLELQDVDPTAKWNKLVYQREPQIKRTVMQMSESKYLVARTETNLQGQGFFNSVAAGNYWLTSLDVTANVGDARPRWDMPVVVKPNNTAYVTLANVNAVQPDEASAVKP